MKYFIQSLLALAIVMFIGCGGGDTTPASVDENSSETVVVSTTDEVENYLIVKRFSDIGNIKVVNESESKLYVANSEGVVYIYSLDDPSNPTYISSYETNDIVEDIEIYNDKIYIANNQNGLIVLTLNQDNVLVNTATLAMSGYARGVDIYNGVIYVASGYGGINMFNLTTLEKYEPINVDGDYTDSIVIKDNYAITSDAYSNFTTITNLTTKAKVTELEKTYPFYEARDDISLSSDKNSIFLADGIGGFKIFDITNIETPIERSTTQILDKDTQHITLSKDNSLAFISTLNSGIYIYDVSDSSYPNFVNHIDLNESENQVVGSSDSVLGEDGNYLYIAARNGGLIVLSIPSQTTTTTTTRSLLDLTNWDTYGSASIVDNNLVVGDSIGYDSDDIDSDLNMWNLLADGSTQYDYDVLVSKIDLTPPIKLNFTATIRGSQYGYNEIGIGTKSTNFANIVGEGLPLGSKATFNMNWEKPNQLELFVKGDGYIDTTFVESSSYSGDFSIYWDGKVVEFYYNNSLVGKEPLVYSEGEEFKIFVKTYETSFDISKISLD